MLLPVMCLLRRLYSAEIIWSALVAKVVSGQGWRRVAAEVGVAGETVRGWLRRFEGRAERVRVFFTRAGVATGIDLPPVAATGSVVSDAVAAVGLLAAGVRQRFGTGRPTPFDDRLVGPDGDPVPSWQVACAASGGRLLAPGWPG